MSRIRSRVSPGMTLVELVTAMLVSAGIVLGLTIGLNNFYYHYQEEAIILDIKDYGRSVLNLVTREISLAQAVEVDHFNGYSRIRMKKGSGSFFNDVVVTGRENDGLLINNNIPIEGTLRLPAFGEGRRLGQRRITLQNFEMIPTPVEHDNLQRFAKAYWEIHLVIRMESNVLKDGRRKQEDVEFHRSVFIPNTYISGNTVNYAGTTG